MATGLTIVVARVFQIALDTMEFVDQVQRDVSTPRLAFRLHFLRLNKLAPQQTCALRAPSRPNAQLRPARPTRYNRRSHRSSSSLYSHLAGV